MCLPDRLRRALESWGFETDRREIDGTRKHENSTGEAIQVATKTNPMQTQTREMMWYIVEFFVLQARFPAGTTTVSVWWVFQHGQCDR